MGCNCNESKSGMKILSPKELTKSVQTFIENVQSDMDIDLKQCSMYCQWFTVCDPKCKPELICWWVCNLDNGREQKVMAPKELAKNIQDAIESVRTNNSDMPDIMSCSYHCEWITVCDPKCKPELICWWYCD